MITTVLRNLLSNALKFTPTNGTIKIILSNENEICKTIVSDSGIGIDENINHMLFNTSQTTSTNGTEGEKGTGIGLVLCKDSIDRNGGKIWAESKIGQGSQFIFTLPTDHS